MARITSRLIKDGTSYFIELPLLDTWESKKMAVINAVHSILDDAIGNIRLFFDPNMDPDYLDVIMEVDSESRRLKWYRRDGNNVRLRVV